MVISVISRLNIQEEVQYILSFSRKTESFDSVLQYWLVRNFLEA